MFLILVIKDISKREPGHNPPFIWSAYYMSDCLSCISHYSSGSPDKREPQPHPPGIVWGAWYMTDRSSRISYCSPGGPDKRESQTNKGEWSACYLIDCSSCISYCSSVCCN
jgi:hypothetical protein